MSSPFTVLVPLWRGDAPDRFADALASATTSQSLRPDELLVVVDGPVPEDLERVLVDVEAGRYGPARVRRCPEHRGLAPVLQEGLTMARTELVARADADDLCRPERFARQIPLMDELDLLGSAMQEFSDERPPGRGPLRRRPLTHEAIRDYLPFHSPFHHPTVVMRREVALAAGGYRVLDHLEDYWLWERMLLAGARTANLPEVLVDYRVDTRLFARRGGWRMFTSDLRLQRILWQDRVTTPGQMLANIGRRGAYRFAPGWLRRVGYRTVVEGVL
ncbi:glycosyltransferase [Brachybacterium phenoliresistens]|uniref:glycosyltransferase n=1 Tax=Brachybacterium phenoliresistens TaxID=396014 RepID=UPI0031E0D1C2